MNNFDPYLLPQVRGSMPRNPHLDKLFGQLNTALAPADTVIPQIDTMPDWQRDLVGKQMDNSAHRTAALDVEKQRGSNQLEQGRQEGRQRSFELGVNAGLPIEEAARDASRASAVLNPPPSSGDVPLPIVDNSITGSLTRLMNQRVPDPTGRSPFTTQRVGVRDFIERALAHHGQGWVDQNVHEIVPFLQEHYTTSLAGGKTDMDFRKWWEQQTSILGSETPDERARGILSASMRRRNANSPSWGYFGSGPSLGFLSNTARPIPANIKEILAPRPVQ